MSKNEVFVSVQWKVFYFAGILYRVKILNVTVWLCCAKSITLPYHQIQITEMLWYKRTYLMTDVNNLLFHFHKQWLHFMNSVDNFRITRLYASIHYPKFLLQLPWCKGALETLLCWVEMYMHTVYAVITSFYH